MLYHVCVTPFLTGVRAHGRIVTAVTAGAEDGRATLVVDVGRRHGVQFEGVGSVIENSRKQCLGALTNLQPRQMIGTITYGVF